MNFLAHLTLSPQSEQKMLGNFFADAVKGKSYLTYQPEIQDGIILHRQIDAFTDSHPIVLHTNHLIQPVFGKFAGVVSDIYYDHFLVQHWNTFCEEPLRETIQRLYLALVKNWSILPKATQRTLPFLLGYNWMENYGDFEHLNMVFQGMTRRAKFVSGMEHGVDVLQQNYTEIEKDFLSYFPLLLAHFSPENSVIRS